MKTLGEVVIEWRNTGNRTQSLAEMPGFKEWVLKSFPCFAGKMLGKNSFNDGLSIGRYTRLSGPCKYDSDPFYLALVDPLSSAPSFSVYKEKELVRQYFLTDTELVEEIAKCITVSGHPHWKQWDLYHWGWDIVPTNELVSQWDLEKEKKV